MSHKNMRFLAVLEIIYSNLIFKASQNTKTKCGGKGH